MTEKPVVYIEQAYIEEHPTWARLIGWAKNHPRLGRGSVYTSFIVNHNGVDEIETNNTLYKVLSWDQYFYTESPDLSKIILRKD